MSKETAATDVEVEQAREQTRTPGYDLGNESVRKLILRIDQDGVQIAELTRRSSAPTRMPRSGRLWSKCVLTSGRSAPHSTGVGGVRRTSNRIGVAMETARPTTARCVGNGWSG